MTLQEKIDALPEWPETKDFFHPSRLNYDAANAQYHHARAEVALARLALARESITELRDWISTLGADALTEPCVAELDALLKALEVKP